METEQLPHVSHARGSHGWGIRTQVDESVHVWTPGHIAAPGRLTNISISGGLVLSSLPVHLWSRVNVRLPASTGLKKPRTRIEAQIVRLEKDGFAVEWSEFAPLAVRAVIRNARAQILTRQPVGSTQNG